MMCLLLQDYSSFKKLIKKSKQTFKRLDLHLSLKSQQGAPAKKLSQTYKESHYYHRSLLPAAWKCDLFCSTVVEFCWDWKIDYSFFKKARCFVPSTNRFYFGWLRLYLCQIGTSNVSALIFPPPLYSVDFCDLGTRMTNAGLEVQGPKHAKSQNQIGIILPLTS